MSKEKPKWIKHSSQTVHENNWFKVEKDEVTAPDGREGEYYTVVSAPAVFIIPEDDDGDIYLIGQHRYTIDKYSMEIPAGSTDWKDPLESAQKELQEETGFTAKNWEKLGEFYSANGLLREKAHLYLATGLKQTGNNAQAEEGIDKTYKLSLDKILGMIQSGEIQDGQTISSLVFLLKKKGLIKT